LLQANLESDPQVNDNCKANPSWRDFWDAEFVRLGWVKPQGQPGETLNHYYDCGWQRVLGFGPGYYRLLDTINLSESNVVFELNGKFFRKRAELFSTHRTLSSMADQLEIALQGFFPCRIMQFPPT
jgi:hypothetical protein